MIALADKERVSVTPGKRNIEHILAAAVFLSPALSMATVVPSIETARISSLCILMMNLLFQGTAHQ